MEEKTSTNNLGGLNNEQLQHAILVGISEDPALYWQVKGLLPRGAFTDQQFDEIAEAVKRQTPLHEIAGPPEADPLAAAAELARRHQVGLLQSLAEEFSDRLRSGRSAKEILEHLDRRLGQVRMAIKGTSSARFNKLQDLLREVVADVQKRSDAIHQGHRATIGLPTGIDTLDGLLGGLQPGLHILSAEPTAGKTTMALQIAVNAAKAGYPVLFVTFEEAPERLTMKAICQLGNLEAVQAEERPSLIMKKFELGKGDPGIFREAANLYGPQLQTLSFKTGTAKLTVDEVKARALQLLKEYQTDQMLIVVDYLQRWAAGRKEFNEFRHKVTVLIGDLREVSMALRSPVLAISSQNRSGEGTSELTSLKESGDLEYTADTITFLVQGKILNPNESEVKLGLQKNRFGEKASGRLVFFKELGIFQEAS